MTSKQGQQTETGGSTEVFWLRLIVDGILITTSLGCLIHQLTKGQAFNGSHWTRRAASPGHFWFLIFVQVVALLGAVLVVYTFQLGLL